jgi:hypothetical protein
MVLLLKLKFDVFELWSGGALSRGADADRLAISAR